MAVHKKKLNRKILWVIFLLLLNVIVALGGYAIYCMYVHTYDVQMSTGEIKAISIHDLKEQVQKEASDSIMNISMNVKPSFTEEGLKGDLFITNCIKNKFDIQITITLKDSHKIVLQTAKLKPGMTLPANGLQEKLQVGTYDAAAKIHFYDSDQLVTSDIVDMKLNVES